MALIKSWKMTLSQVRKMIKMPAIFKSASLLFLLLWLAFFSIEAHADIDGAGVLDNVLARYMATTVTWAVVIKARATWLFWTLALISMVWTFGLMALRKADIGEFFAEFFRFTMFTGFFWWLLNNGSTFAVGIMSSMNTIAGNASGAGPFLTPSGIVDIGFDIFFKVLDKSSVWSPIDSTVGIIISLIILIVMGLIGVNMLLLLVSGWILAYAGIFFLGFGGSRWTSDMAIHYFKTVLNIAAQVFTMNLLAGIGKSFVDQYHTNMSVGIGLKELGVMLIVAVVMLALVDKLPAMVGGLAMGGGSHALGSGFGAGAAMSAVTMGGNAVGAAVALGASGLSGLMAAVSKGSQAVAGGINTVSSMGGGGNDGSKSGSNGSSPLAAAMGSSSESGSGGSSSQLGSSRSSSKSDSSGRSPVRLVSGGGSSSKSDGHQTNTEPVFDGNSLAGNSETSSDAVSEVAAFRDRPER